MLFQIFLEKRENHVYAYFCKPVYSSHIDAGASGLHAIHGLSRLSGTPHPYIWGWTQEELGKGKYAMNIIEITLLPYEGYVPRIAVAGHRFLDVYGVKTKVFEAGCDTSDRVNRTLIARLVWYKTSRDDTHCPRNWFGTRKSVSGTFEWGQSRICDRS